MALTTRGRRVTTAICSALVLIAIAGCSSGAKNASTGAAGAASGAAAATGAPIKIGFLCDCSGSPLAFQGIGREQVYKAWVASLNASGGVDGHPLQVIYEDDANLPGNAIADAQQVIGEKVAAIVDSTSLDTTWAGMAEAAHIPVVGILLTTEPFYTNPDFFAEGETNDALLYSIVATAKASGASTLGTLYCAEAPQCQQAVAPIKAAGAQLGVSDIYNSDIAATAPNYTAQCVAAQQAHVQALFIADSSPEVTRAAQNCAAENYDPTYLVEGNGYAPEYATATGLKTNLWAAFNDMPYFAKTSAVAQMNAAVDKYFPGVRQNASSWTQLNAMAWPSGLLLEDAIKAGGLTPSAAPSAAEVLKGLYALRGDTLGGWSPPLTFTQGRPTSVDCWFVGRVQSGVETVENGGKPYCKSA